MSMKLYFNKGLLKCKKHSPEILLAGGIVGVVTAGVMACKATLKVNDVKQEKLKDIIQIKETAKDPEYADKYTKKDADEDLTKVYVQMGFQIAKLYAPSIIIGALSLTSIIFAHNIQTRRNLALAAAYSAVDTGFKKYRESVKERFGEETDKDILYNRVREEVEVTDEKTGKKKKKKETVEVLEDAFLKSPYAKFFDASSRCWEKDPEYNLHFLYQQQNLANDYLRSRGYLFLNEVYDMLDIPVTKSGQVTGWFLDKNDKNDIPFVDFGILKSNRRSLNGLESVFVIDPNVQGNILDKI